MPVRSFRQIAPVEYSAASNILSGAGETINRGFDSFNQALGGLEKRNVAQEDLAIKNNDKAISAGLDQFKSLADLNQAEKEGKLSDTALQTQFGGKYTPEVFGSNLKAIKARLKGDTINSASEIAFKEAETTGDITKAQSAMHKALKDSGMSSTETMAATTKWGENAGVIKDKIAKDKTDKYNSALQSLDDSISSGSDNVKNRNKIRASLPPEMRSQFDAEARTISDNRSKLTPDQKLEYDYMSQKNKDRIGGAIQQGELQLKGMEGELNQIPMAVSPVVANEFENVTDAGSHVLEKFAAVVRDPLTAGVVNAILSPFSGVTTGDDALGIINQKYQNLITSGSVTDKEAAALLWESWKATMTSHETLGAPGVNAEAFDKEIARRTQAMQLRKQKQGEINAARLKFQSGIQTMQANDRDQKYQFTKGSMKTNRTGKPMASFNKATSEGNKVNLTNKATPSDIVKRVLGNNKSAPTPKDSGTKPVPLDFSKLIKDTSPKNTKGWSTKQREDNFKKLKKWQKNK